VLTGDSVLRVRIDANAAGNPDACEVMIDQSRAIDNQRFQRELGDLPDSLLATVAARLRQVGDL
jgi:mRNA-degrading endonuclease toxin of MazEF toxin-antitoxin module